MRTRSWTKEQLIDATKSVTSVRQLLSKLGLREAGGNYKQISKYLSEFGVDTSHFRGKGWSKGLVGIGKPRFSTELLLVKGGTFQSHKLKKRLFKDGLKKELCEICGWAMRSRDGRIPLELDHINGDSSDNTLSNLRILCPNCHSLQLTHRGRNIKK